MWHTHINTTKPIIICIGNTIQYEIGKYQDELRTLLNDEEDEDIFSKLNILGDFSKKEYINVPYCLCLISKYPFIEQME